MEKFDLKELWDLWQQGKSINDAIVTFLDCASIKKQVRKKLKNSEATIKIIGTGLMGEQQKQQQKTIEISEYKIEILKNLYEKIKSEQLLAIGYMEPIGGSDLPDLIPQNFWPPHEISLENSSVKFQKAHFSNVRIAKNPKREIDYSQYDSGIVPVGRSTYKELLVEAYEYLLDQGQINYSKSFNSHVKKIRKAVRDLHPEISDNKNMADKTIKKHLSPRFQSEKGKNL